MNAQPDYRYFKNLRFSQRIRFALRGLIHTAADSASLRTQLAAGLLAIGLFILFKASPVWWAILFLTIFGVLAAELINSSLEHLLDALHPSAAPLIGLAKDCAAAAVLLLCTGAVAVLICFLVVALRSHRATT